MINDNFLGAVVNFSLFTIHYSLFLVPLQLKTL